MNDDLKIKPKKPRKNKKIVSEALRSKAVTKVKMLARKFAAGTATEEDFEEAGALMRVIDEKVKPGTPIHAAMMRLKGAVERQLQRKRQEAQETGSDGGPMYLN